MVFARLVNPCVGVQTATVKSGLGGTKNTEKNEAGRQAQDRFLPENSEIGSIGTNQKTVYSSRGDASTGWTGSLYSEAAKPSALRRITSHGIPLLLHLIAHKVSKVLFASPRPSPNPPPCATFESALISPPPPTTHSVNWSCALRDGRVSHVGPLRVTFTRAPSPAATTEVLASGCQCPRPVCTVLLRVETSEPAE